MLVKLYRPAPEGQGTKRVSMRHLRRVAPDTDDDNAARRP
jgi:hypothetical protein